MSVITSLKGRIIYNSRGSKTIEIDVIADNKYLGRASSPSGASVGSHEVPSYAHNNLDLSLKLFNANKQRFIGLDAKDFKTIFDTLKAIDGTETYKRIGGAVAYSLSIAALEAASKSEELPMFKLINPEGPYRYPFPLGNVLGGGAHAGPGTPDIQEILVCPIGAECVINALEMNFKVHGEVKSAIERLDNKFTYGRGDEGAWAPNLNNDRAIIIVAEAIQSAGFQPGKDMAIGIDFAASSLWDKTEKTYNYRRQGISRTPEEQIQFVLDLIKKHNLVYVEDPVHEDDFEGMAKVTKEGDCFVAGDDMLVTSVKRLEIAGSSGACNSAILKVNQAGGLQEALDFAKICNSMHLGIITSHRSGESVDSHISHIAVATSSKMIKTGILGGERIAKLNELVRLSEYDLIDGMAELSNI